MVKNNQTNNNKTTSWQDLENIYGDNVVEAYKAFTGNEAGEIDYFDDCYQGVYQNPREFARDFVESYGHLDDLPYFIKDSIDYTVMARYLELEGYQYFPMTGDDKDTAVDHDYDGAVVVFLNF